MGEGGGGCGVVVCELRRGVGKSTRGKHSQYVVGVVQKNLKRMSFSHCIDIYTRDLPNDMVVATWWSLTPPLPTPPTPHSLLSSSPLFFFDFVFFLSPFHNSFFFFFPTFTFTSHNLTLQLINCINLHNSSINIRRILQVIVYTFNLCNFILKNGKLILKI